MQGWGGFLAEILFCLRIVGIYTILKLHVTAQIQQGNARRAAAVRTNSTSLLIRELNPKDVNSTCAHEPYQIAEGSYGHVFLLALTFNTHISNVQSDCDFKWFEAATEDTIWDDGTIIGLKGRKVDNSRNPHTKNALIFENYRKDLNKKCPSNRSSAIFHDCPVASLKRDGDARLLCIEVVVSGSCDSCPFSIIKFVKQKCRHSNGVPKCTIEYGDTPCSPDEWKEFGLEIGAEGPLIWIPGEPH